MKLFVITILTAFSSLAFAQEVNCYVTPACEQQDANAPDKCFSKLENNENELVLRKVDQNGIETLSYIPFTTLSALTSGSTQVPNELSSNLANVCQKVQVTKQTSDGWKVRFHFGYTRTDYRPTDVKLKSSAMNTTIKGFEFDERTSGDHYNPKTWKGAQDALRWIDEPSNTLTISIENKNNAFYITAFHPKFLKTYYIGTDENGQTVYTPVGKDLYLSEGTAEAYNAIPEGQKAIEIKNTHLLMNYQIGYGRKFTLFNSPQAGKLTYIARADVGVMVGGARTTLIDENKQLTENNDALGVQGYTASLGHRLEYQRGRTGVYIEQKGTTTKIEHGFLDGTASYNLNFSTITFGATYDIFRGKKKTKK